MIIHMKCIYGGFIMAFIYEIVPEKDYSFFDSMHLKNPFGKGFIYATRHSHWCADRERNAFLIPLGGIMHDTPYFIDLWIDGHIIIMEAEQYGKMMNGNVVVGWDIVDILIPNKAWDKKELIVSIAKEALKKLHQNDFEDMLDPKISCECRMMEGN